MFNHCLMLYRQKQLYLLYNSIVKNKLHVLAQEHLHLASYEDIHENTCRPIYFFIDYYIKPDDRRLGPKHVAY
jgi:hypothetical protein